MHVTHSIPNETIFGCSIYLYTDHYLKYDSFFIFKRTKKFSLIIFLCCQNFNSSQKEMNTIGKHSSIILQMGL